jgi:UDP-glucose:(heptosyl)LPS alpha-1,3-glucosyltransferase
MVKREVRRHYPLPDERLATLFNAVDLERFYLDGAAEVGKELRRRHGIAEDKIAALMIAQNYRLKGLAETINAVARVNDPRLVLIVVGKESTTVYDRQARRLGIDNQIIFAGATTDARSYYAAVDFFVLPTRRDSCSLVVLEALAMGVPVISTATNGACEIMQDGQHGFVLSDPTDIAALAGAMARMMDADFRRACAEECRQLRGRLAFDEHVLRLE